MTVGSLVTNSLPMASFSLSSILHTPSSSFNRLVSLRISTLSPSTLHFSDYFQPSRISIVRSQTFHFSDNFFENGIDGPPSPGSPEGTGWEEEDEPEILCPPGLRRYETMAVLRVEIDEHDRLAFIEEYKKLLIEGGGMYVQVFNRGVIPLSYKIKKRNKAGETNTYLDGISILFTYFTKPESMTALDAKLKSDDDVIRSSSFKMKKRKYN